MKLIESTGDAAAAIRGKAIHSVIGHGRQERRKDFKDIVVSLTRREATLYQQEHF